MGKAERHTAGLGGNGVVSGIDVRAAMANPRSRAMGFPIVYEALIQA